VNAQHQTGVSWRSVVFLLSVTVLLCVFMVWLSSELDASRSQVRECGAWVYELKNANKQCNAFAIECIQRGAQ
jgi:hypothetical protein